MNIDLVGPQDATAIAAFFEALPEGDITFMKEEIPTPETAADWLSRLSPVWVASEDDEILGIAAIPSLSGWSDHVCELRLIVGSQSRRRGVGRRLTQQAVLSAMRAGKRKVIVELIADQEDALGMFASLGFEGEALLRGHFRDRTGELRDLIMLACYVGASSRTFEVLGIADELG